MHWSLRRVLSGILTIALVPSVTFAQAVDQPRTAAPAAWEKVDALQASGDVTVLLTSGERRRYRLSATTPDTLRLVSSSGAVDVVAKSSVATIENRYDDPVGNGIAIGVAVGAAAGFALVGGMYNACRDGCEAPSAGPVYLTGIAMGAGIGSVTGWLIDKAHKSKKVVYAAPVMTNGRKGVAVSVRY